MDEKEYKKYKESVTIEIVADTAEFEKGVDRCIAKVKELIQLGEQAGRAYEFKFVETSNTGRVYTVIDPVMGTTHGKWAVQKDGLNYIAFQVSD